MKGCVLFRELRRLLAFSIVLFCLRMDADTLFRGKDPVRIGKGAEDGGKIRWSDCDGGNISSYKHPPYTLDVSENCSVGPPTFGLECENERCKVVDEAKIKKYLPDAKEGDVVNLQIQDHIVVLRGKEKTIRLKK